MHPHPIIPCVLRCIPQCVWWRWWYLGLLLLSGVHDGGAADLGDLAPLAVEGPAADLVADHVLDEEDAPVEAQGQLVEQLDVLQHVVVRVAARRGRRKSTGREGSEHRK